MSLPNFRRAVSCSSCVHYQGSGYGDSGFCRKQTLPEHKYLSVYDDTICDLHEPEVSNGPSENKVLEKRG